MSETCTVASMDHRKGRMPFSSDLKNELLRKLQGRIHFERTLSLTNVSLRGRSTLALPVWFVRKHGDKFRRSVTLRSDSSTKSWPVKVTIAYRSPTDTQVRFLGGWNAFATSHGLQEGDSLVFSLTAMSEFDVYIIPSTRNPKGCPSQAAPRKLSRKRTKQEPVNENKNEQALIHDGGLGGDMKSNELFPKEMAVGEKLTVSASGLSSTSCSLLSNNQEWIGNFESEKMQDFSSRGRHNSPKNRQEPALDHAELIMVSSVKRNCPAQHTVSTKYTVNVFQDSALQKITRLLQFPGFSRKLTITNVFDQGCMVIPPHFWRTYGSRLHSVVKLQGIREDSEVRTVPCVLPISNGKRTRIYLRAGWREFSDENDLEVGQELLFALTADSFFVVREMQPPSTEISRD